MRLLYLWGHLLFISFMMEDTDDFDFQLLDDDIDSNDLGTIYPCTQNIVSKYITKDEVNDFCNFSDPTALNILHINCRSIKRNFGSLTNFINLFSSHLTAIAVTETWLTESLNDVYSIPGYNFFANSRTMKLGGGVGLYVKKNLSCKIRPDLCRMSSYIECIFLECQQVNMKSFIIGSIYRPPNSDISQFNSDLLTILNDLTKSKHKLAFLAGDFNLNLINANTHAATGEFLNNLQSFNFAPTVKNPTRISDTSATLIDNIFINGIEREYTCSSAIIYSDISDHLPVALHLKRNSRSKSYKTVNYANKRYFDSKSIDEFNTELANID